MWILVFAALYFSPLTTFAYAGGLGLGYALALTFGPPVNNPVASWLVVVGTGAFAGAIVLGLVGVLRSDARQDHLTGLANRRSWDERLDEEIDRSRRTGTLLSVAVIDLDGFKKVNDRGDHDAGDRVLEEFAATSRFAVRAGDLVARIGGDEFGLLAPNAGEVGIGLLTDRLFKVTEEEVAYSIGTATWDGQESGAGSFFHRADEAMYRDKLQHRSSRQGSAIRSG